MNVMAVSDVEFNQALIDAGVFCCAYGHRQVKGFPAPIPSLTLVGENRAAFERAFEHFAHWGCVEDGDSVDIHMMLKLNGTYEMWIGPEIERSTYRMVPQAELYRPLMFNVSWVKSFDSTQPVVRNLKRYCESPISPVAVTAALGNPRRLNVNRIDPIDGLPRLVKFELQIIDEGEAGADPRFHPRNEHPKPNREALGDPLSPAEYCRRRKRTIDIAFPVSRERVRRSGLLNRVRELPTFAHVSDTQVVQAAINLMLSAELSPGDRHYSQIAKGLSKKIWDHIASRFETANGKLSPADQEPAIVARQLELDVRHVLMQHGVPTAGERFEKLQAFFRRKGYIDD